MDGNGGEGSTGDMRCSRVTLRYIDDRIEDTNEWGGWMMILSWWMVVQSYVWVMQLLVHMVLREHTGLTREWAACGTIQDGGNWVVLLPRETTNLRNIQIIGERGEASLDSDDSEGDLARIQNESSSNDLE